MRDDTVYTYYDNGWTRSATDPFGITTSYDYNELGRQTRNTLTSAGGSSSRTMTWDFYPSGNQKARSDDGVPVGRHVVLVDSSDTHNTAVQGVWESSQATDQWGYNLRTHAAGDGSARFVWQLTIPQDGTYEVFVRHGDVTGAAGDAPFTVTHASGEAQRTVDQSTRAGEWISLGSYSFTESAPQKITLTDGATGTVVADAVKLVRDNTGETDTEEKDFTYRYDANGLLTEVRDLSPNAEIDTYTISYDGLNQMVKVEEKSSGTVRDTTAITYDANGNITSSTHDLTWSKIEYDIRDMVAKVTNADSPTADRQQVSTFTYTDRRQPLKQVKPNGNTVDFTYYLDGPVKSQVEKTATGTVVARHDLEYDPNGNRSKDTAKLMNADDSADLLETVSTFAYDPLDRIAKVTKTGDGAGTETYVHDANHNVVEQTIGGVTTTTTYDRNRLLKTTTNGVSATYNYDPLGRLDTVSSNGTIQEKYSYDGFDRIAEHTAGSGTAARTTTYTYDAFDRTVTETTSGTSGKTKAFVYLAMDDQVLREEEPYNAYRFNGHRWDAASGTYDMGFRSYDPGLNRFLTRDLYGGALADMGLATDPFTNNRYAFAGGNPISFVELDGHLFGMSWSDIGHATLDVVGMVPVVGEVADVANGLWYMAKGNYVDGALSMAAAIPGAGTAATAAKWAEKGAGAAGAANDARKTTKTAPKSKPKQDKPKEDKPATCPAKKPHSFLPGTRVLMADGSTKAIEDLKTGDQVLATDPETGDTRAREVTDTRSHRGGKHLVTLTVDADGSGGDAPEEITSTEGHPYWLPDAGRWVEAGDLEAGMWLRTSAGTWVQITAIDHTHRTQRVHNLTVDGVHTYYALAGRTQLLVHNCGDPVEVTIKRESGMPKAEFERKATALQKLSGEGKLYKAPNPVARESSVTRQYKGDLIRPW